MSSVVSSCMLVCNVTWCTCYNISCVHLHMMQCVTLNNFPAILDVSWDTSLERMCIHLALMNDWNRSSQVTYQDKVHYKNRTAMYYYPLNKCNCPVILSSRIYYRRINKNLYFLSETDDITEWIYEALVLCLTSGPHPCNFVKQNRVWGYVNIQIGISQQGEVRMNFHIYLILFIILNKFNFWIYIEKLLCKSTAVTLDNSV